MLLDAGPLSAWGTNSVFFSLLVSTAGGPWLASRCMHHAGVDASMTAAGLLGAATSCAVLAANHWAVEVSSQLEASKRISLLKDALRTAWRDTRLWALFSGVVVAAAFHSAQALLVPLHRQALAHSAAAAGLAETAAFFGICLGFAVLACGWLGESLGDRASIKGMVVGLILSALGLRALVAGLGSANGSLSSIGLVASHVGLGCFLGMAPLVLLKCMRCHRGLPALPSTSAVASSILTSCWIVGDAVGIGIQMAPNMLAVYRRAMLTMAAALVLQAFLAMTGRDPCSGDIPEKLFVAQTPLRA